MFPRIKNNATLFIDFSGFGQSEPLTNRLKRLLEDYTDGFAIPKELVQNADDAGATEVNQFILCPNMLSASEIHAIT